MGDGDQDRPFGEPDPELPFQRTNDVLGFSPLTSSEEFGDDGDFLRLTLEVAD